MRAPRSHEGPVQGDGEVRDQPGGLQRHARERRQSEVSETLTSSSSVLIRSGRMSTTLFFGGRCTRAGVRFRWASRPL